MTIVWDEVGTHEYETGTSKGILFPMDSAGVPWNGLTNVSIDVSGGEPESYYFDGVKYFDAVLAEDFQATISAVSAPPAFAACEGYKTLTPGMSTPFKTRAKFNLCWRTEIGNDLDNAAGYKIHLVYNATVLPSQRQYATLTDVTTPDIRTWVIKTTPACGKDSYYVFDSRAADLSGLEALLNAGTLPACGDLPTIVASGGGGGGGGPVDPCPSILTDLEKFNAGQVVNTDDFVDGSYEEAVVGVVNSGMNVAELPANGTFSAVDSDATKVGTGAVVADADDATYITSSTGDLGYTLRLAALVGWVPGSQIELHIRMSLSGDVDPDDPDNIDADAQVFITTDGVGDLAVGGFSDGTDDGMSFSIPFVDGSINDYVVPLDLDTWTDSSIDAVVTALENAAYLNVVAINNNNPDPAETPVAIVYEASVVIIDGTDTDKYLRTAAPTNVGKITHHLYDPSDNRLQSSATATVDFKLLELPQNPDVVGFVDKVMTWNESGGDDPGKVVIVSASLTLTGDLADVQLKWTSTDDATTYATIGLNKNAWYTATFDWSWATARLRIALRDDPTTYLLDQSRDTSSQTPIADSAYYAGMVGDADHTYEVVIDNAHLQANCHDPGPITVDVLLTKGQRVQYNEAGVSTQTVINMPADGPIDFNFTRYPDPAFDHGADTFFYPQEWGGHAIDTTDFIPATPDGHVLSKIIPFVKAYRTGGAPDTITADTSTWGYNEPPTMSPWLESVNAHPYTFSVLPTSEPANPIFCANGWDPAHEQYQAALYFSRWITTVLTPPYPAEPRHIIMSQWGLRFVFSPI